IIGERGKKRQRDKFGKSLAAQGFNRIFRLAREELQRPSLTKGVDISRSTNLALLGPDQSYPVSRRLSGSAFALQLEASLHIHRAAQQPRLRPASVVIRRARTEC